MNLLPMLGVSAIALTLIAFAYVLGWNLVGAVLLTAFVGLLAYSHSVA